MVLLSGRRCARLCHALLVAVVLLAGQRHAVLADGDAMDASNDVDAGGVPENTLEACVDPTPMVEALEQEKTQLKNEFDDCDDKRTRLEHMMKSLETNFASQEKVLEGFGGEKGIQKLAQAAASAGDVTIALKEAEESAEEARKEAASAKKEADAARKEAEEAKKEAASAKAEAAAAEEQAASLAADKETLQSKLDAADKELETLRSNLSKAESKESKAREEHSRTAEDMRVKLERTASELELAKKPRVVSMSAIYADLKHLVRELVEQSKEARDDIVQKASEKVEQVRVVVQPHIEAAVEASKPILKQAMDKTEPHRAKAGEVFQEYRGKFDDKMGAPAAEKLSIVRVEVSKAWQQASSTCDEVGDAFVSKLMGAGVSKNDAQKTLKYLNIGVMCLFFGVLCWYLLRATVTSIVWPLLRTVLRLALWLVKLPFRILFLPIRLVLWVLTKCFRLVFGGGKGGAKSPRATTNAKK